MKGGRQGGIGVYYSRFTQPFSDAVRKRYGEQLTFDPRFATKRYRRWQDAQAHLMGRLLLLQAGKTFGNNQSAIPPLLYSKYQRPYFADGPDFSISHSGEYVLCAMSGKGQVGVDVEKIRPIDLADMQPSFSPKEWAEITAADQPNRRLFDYWTRKEAVAKADGRGMMIADRIVLSDSNARIDDQHWCLQKLAVADDYCAYLASKLEANPLGSVPSGSDLVTMTYVNFDPK